MQPPPTSAAARARRRIGPRAVVLLAVLGLVAAELLLARRGYGSERLVRADATRGYAIVGGQEIDGPYGTTERINAAGFRERDWSAEDPGRPLVVVLGHSVSYGVGVEAEERWTAHLEAGLRAGPAPRARVLDLAVPGYTLEQMLAVHAEAVRPLAPEVVVVEVGDYSARPMVRLSEPVDFPLAEWIRRTALYDFLYRRSGHVRTDDERMGPFLDDPDAEAHAHLWGEAFARLEGLRVELAERGARLVVLHTPLATRALGIEAEPSRWSAWCAAHPDVLEVDCSEDLRERMRPLAEELAAQGIDPRLERGRMARLEPDRFAQRASACFFLDDLQHLSPLGHEVVGARVTEALAPLLAE